MVTTKSPVAIPILPHPDFPIKEDGRTSGTLIGLN